jgi:REP element-mobilizing transposase RayT
LKESRPSPHTLSRLTVYLVWVTKYRYHVLEGEIKVRFVFEDSQTSAVFFVWLIVEKFGF